MKLRALYSNDEAIFPRMNFLKGFNVVFAQVSDATLRNLDTHNLGKTFLIEVIDFALLKKIDGSHPFKSNPALFEGFVFYLDVEAPDGRVHTVRRQASGGRPVCILTHTPSMPDPREIALAEWQYHGLGIDRGREILGSLLRLEAIYPYGYRKGLGYSLRKQGDYEDVFQISRFVRGKHLDWKPYLAKVLGFDYEHVENKYRLDQAIAGMKQQQGALEGEAQLESGSSDELMGMIQIRSESAAHLRRQLARFSFRQVEADINEDVVQRIEREVSNLNEERYKLDYELQQLRDSPERDSQFDLAATRRVFEQANLVLSDQIVRSYEELIDFHRRLRHGREQRVSDLERSLTAQLEDVNSRLRDLDDERSTALQALRDRRTMEKYRSLQARLLQREREVAELELRLEQLDRASSLQSDIESLERERDAEVTHIREDVKSQPGTYRKIRSTFSSYVEDVLDVQALLSVSVNRDGNLDFSARILHDERVTSEASGTTYKKILCACFDLAVLATRSTDAYYHFVYHDGIFEGLDNRKKVALLDLVRRVCEQRGIQYILSVIDTDLPRDEEEKKLLFSEEEVVRKLHDGGSQGRLFRTEAF